MAVSSATRRNLLGWVIVLWVATLAVIAVRVAVSPGRHTVFPIFVEAGRHWLEGSTPYAPPTPGLDQFRYSPTMAAFFGPWSLIPSELAEVLWRVLNVGVFVVGLWAWCRIVGVFRSSQTSAAPVLVYPRCLLPFAFALLVTWPLALGSLNNGQANLLVAGLMLLAVAGFDRGRLGWAAVAIVAATLFKGYPLALGMLLCVLSPWRFGWRLAVGLAVGFILPFGLQSPTWVAQQYGEWWHRLGCDDRSAFPITGGYQNARTLLQAVGVAMPTWLWEVSQVLAGVACAAVVAVDRRVWVAGAWAMLWMTLFGPATETCTWVLLSPVAAWATWAVRGRAMWERALVWGAGGVLILVVVAIGFPAVGKPLLAFAPQPLAGVMLGVWLARQTRSKKLVLRYLLIAPTRVDKLASSGRSVISSTVSP